jgi:predicted CXXCH cytochrome family protein
MPLIGIVRKIASRSPAWLLIAATGCSGGGDPDLRGALPRELARGDLVGIALEVEDGRSVPLRLAAGRRYYVDQMDFRASVTADHDNGVDTLSANNAFAALPWGSAVLEDTHFLVLPDGDGMYTRRRFYDNADWMSRDSTITVEQVDATGQALGAIMRFDIGADRPDQGRDAFFIRRLRAIQWTYDCPGSDDCTGARDFLEEALVELRHAARRDVFELDTETTGLRVRWSLLLGTGYLIPVEQVQKPEYDYGFTIDVEPLTPARPDGTYAPGSAIDFRISLRDGSGRRLHPKGSLPTYNEVIAGHDAGIQYYRAFFDATTVYYRRKHRERMFMVQMIGPAQDVQPIHSVVPLAAFLAPDDDVQHIGLPQRDGVFADFLTFPVGRNLLGGGFEPDHRSWDLPVSDTWTFEIPDNARSGTYLVTAKARRVYLGQDIPFTRTIELQVGQPQRTQVPLNTGPCTNCHSGYASLANLLHANNNRGACIACHSPLEFELEGTVYVRVHFIHSRSDRYPAPLQQCSTCHLDSAGIQRASKSACLSCHMSYPKDHVAQFGPVHDMYVGGGPESFQSCDGACHTTHPQSGLDLTEPLAIQGMQ